MQTITFVRHGQSMANVGAITAEHHSVALTQAGRAQAAELADLLPQQCANVLVSPFERAQHTALPYCTKLGLTAQVVPLLHEFETTDPDLTKGMTGAERVPLIDAYWAQADVSARMGPRAESFTEFAGRVEAFKQDVLPQLPDSTVIFGHGMWNALLYWRLMGFSVNDAFAMKSFRRFQIGFPMPNGAAYRVQQLQPGQWRLEADDAVMRRMVQIASLKTSFD